MVQPFNGKADRATNNGTVRPADSAADESENGSCPLYDHVLKAHVRRAGYETPVQRIQAVDSNEHDARDGPTPMSGEALEQTPKLSLLQNFSRLAREKDVDPTVVVWLDRAGDVHLLTRTLKTPQRFPRTIFTKGFRQKLSNPDYEINSRDQDDIDVPSSLSETEKVRNTHDACRCGHNERSSTKRRNTSPTPGSSRRRQKMSQSKSQKDNDDEEDFELDVVDEFEVVQTELKELRVDSLEDWYDFAFRSMSQLALKDIAKAWIRKCVPKKQSNNPYNGGHTAAESQALWPGTKYSGHLTRPIWWPTDLGWNNINGATGCRHREPDHIKKLERLILVKHLLRYGHQFDLEMMREGTAKLDQKSDGAAKEFPPKTMDRLSEIYRVREWEMRCEESGTDGDSTITVSMPKPKGRGKAKRKASIKSKKSTSIKAESPQSEAAAQKAVPAPVANMSVYASLQAAQVEVDDHEDRNPVLMEHDDDSDTSALPGSSSSVADATPLEKVDLLPTQQEKRTPSHGLPTSAQLEEVISSQPYERYGIEVGDSFVRSARSRLQAVDEHRDFSEQAMREPTPISQAELAVFGRPTVMEGSHAIMLPQQSSAFSLPSSSSHSTHGSTHRNNIHGRITKVAHRQQGPSRICNPNAGPDAQRHQAQFAGPSPPSRPSAPQNSSFIDTPSRFSAFTTMTPSWAANEYFGTQEDSPYTSVWAKGADTDAWLTSSANTSFSSENTDLHIDIHMDPSPSLFPTNEQARQAQDEYYRQNYSTYLGSSIYDIPIIGPSSQTYPYAGPMPMVNSPMDLETKFDPRHQYAHTQCHH